MLQDIETRCWLSRAVAFRTQREVMASGLDEYIDSDGRVAIDEKVSLRTRGEE